MLLEIFLNDFKEFYSFFQNDKQYQNDNKHQLFKNVIEIQKCYKTP